MQPCLISSGYRNKIAVPECFGEPFFGKGLTNHHRSVTEVHRAFKLKCGNYQAISRFLFSTTPI